LNFLSPGYHPFVAPAAHASQGYQNPEGAVLGPCVYCGMCARWGCEMGAKASPQTTLLPALRPLKNFELRTHANVLRILVDKRTGRATGVLYADAQGRRVEQPAELVVLASFVFNNTRLMLLSGIGQAYAPATGTGSVGRNVAYNTLTSVQAFFDDRIFNVFMGAGAMGYTLDDFNADNFDHQGLGFVNGGHISVISGGSGPIGFRPTPPGVPRWGSAWKAAVAKYYNRTVNIAQHGGVLGYRSNHIDLDPTYRDAWGQPLARMTFDWQPNELKMADFLLAKSVDIAKAMGAVHVKPAALERHYTITRYQTSHHSGGTPFGLDRRTSALNRYLQSWDVRNLFVVGASAFPHASGNNPTATVGALTYWAARALVNDYLPRPRMLA
jgi:gluconate 2-dehydrogenase alpha chain